MSVQPHPLRPRRESSSGDRHRPPRGYAQGANLLVKFSGIRLEITMFDAMPEFVPRDGPTGSSD